MKWEEVLASKSKYVVCFNKFFAGKDSVVFSAFVNYNIMLCIEFPSLRLKCDMGEVF